MKKVRIVGVPEHFNFPWNMCIENGEFNDGGIELEWSNIPEGTGKMCQMLKNNETDLAVILTEGIIKDITFGNPSQIIQEFVSSPLLWGIHVANDSEFKKTEDLRNRRVAISRFGSGSHLMAIVHARQMNWNPDELEFIVVNTLEGAIESLSKNKADYFMWERFMTQPIVDKGIFRRLDVCPTPWPSFVIAGRTDFINNNSTVLEQILDIINTTTEEFKLIPSIDRTLAVKYHQKLEDIQEWLQLTQWSQSQIKTKSLLKVQQTLKNLNLIENTLEHESLIRS
ncbi:substrate-binding domain-containing protein [Myroides guanonis]|uniref:NMT1/THI5 like n=1 Tax=Myroides guanonis TaxID=1150112 RepID=A0A1I3TJN0_9FLAO|nr:substrate-binding domain-containing protein [Myroides guanonis]SFJ69836.1 NMT1/THI5 like [Myroides guanonis]